MERCGSRGMRVWASIFCQRGALIMTYTLTAHPNTIVRDEDGAFIPTDPDNMDYQAYLAWLDGGNEPTPYTPPKSINELVEKK